MFLRDVLTKTISLTGCGTFVVNIWYVYKNCSGIWKQIQAICTMVSALGSVFIYIILLLFINLMYKVAILFNIYLFPVNKLCTVFISSNNFLLSFFLWDRKFSVVYTNCIYQCKNNIKTGKIARLINDLYFYVRIIYLVDWVNHVKFYFNA